MEINTTLPLYNALRIQGITYLKSIGGRIEKIGTKNYCTTLTEGQYRYLHYQVRQINMSIGWGKKIQEAKLTYSLLWKASEKQVKTNDKQ